MIFKTSFVFCLVCQTSIASATPAHLTDLNKYVCYVSTFEKGQQTSTTTVFEISAKSTLSAVELGAAKVSVESKLIDVVCDLGELRSGKAL
jgi:hypothetical protein